MSEFCRAGLYIYVHDNIFLRAEVSDFFDRMDRDFDGRLSFGEFMGEETPLEKVFKNMDKDGDGSVSKEVGIINIISTYYCNFSLLLFLGVYKDLQAPDSSASGGGIRQV